MMRLADVPWSVDMKAGSFSKLTIVVAVLVACCFVPAAAGAAQTVILRTSFSPDRLGASTTIGFDFHIAGTTGATPSPLTSVRLSLPPGIGYITTTLGLAVCTPARLLGKGLDGCSPNSRLGTGTALVEAPLGSESVHETAGVQLLMGPPRQGKLVVLFYTTALDPIPAELVFQGELLTGSEVLGGSLEIAVPLVASIPDALPVSILSVQARIGPSGLTYYRRARGRSVAFHPQGVSVPTSCPAGGFRFSANFSFLDGSSAVADSTVPCPSARRGRSRAQPSYRL
jgi:hypothetical protein